MKFKLAKDIRHQLYFVDLEILDITEHDKKKFDDFGEPTIHFKTRSGEFADVKLTDVKFLQSFGFPDLQSAEEYYYSLKIELKELKDNWAQIGNDWDSEEII